MKKIVFNNMKISALSQEDLLKVNGGGSFSDGLQAGESAGATLRGWFEDSQVIKVLLKAAKLIE